MKFQFQLRMDKYTDGAVYRVNGTIQSRKKRTTKTEIHNFAVSHLINVIVKIELFFTILGLCLFFYMEIEI